jgi:PPOX class probable F420-dependent enzyme
MNAALNPISNTKTILLTTYKRDGTPVATPVSLAFDGERAFFRSYDKAWKTRRLRRNPAVQAAPATLRGKPTGPAVRARATLLDGEQARLAARALARRHRILQAILVPTAHRLMRYRTMHYELTPGNRGDHPGRIGGPWLWSTLVRSLFHAVVVPSGFRTRVQPQRWITTWWWKKQRSTQSLTDVGPPLALCLTWCTSQAAAGWSHRPAHWQCWSRSMTALRIPAGIVSE